MQAELGDIAQLIACPHCDALYRAKIPQKGERAKCTRCHAVLIAPRKRAGVVIIAMALTTLVLVLGAMSFPFLAIEAQGFGNAATIWQVALGFRSGPLVLVSVLCVVAVIALPIMRALMTLYVLVPIVFDRRLLPQSREIFAMSEALRPWSMAEIFMLGCAVSLVKVADLADVVIGPAFWMFAGLVVITSVQDTFMCRWSVWKSLEERTRHGT